MKLQRTRRSNPHPALYLGGDSKGPQPSQPIVASLGGPSLRGGTRRPARRRSVARQARRWDLAKASPRTPRFRCRGGSSRGMEPVRRHAQDGPESAAGLGAQDALVDLREAVEERFGRNEEAFSSPVWDFPFQLGRRRGKETLKASRWVPYVRRFERNRGSKRSLWRAKPKRFAQLRLVRGGELGGNVHDASRMAHLRGALR